MATKEELSDQLNMLLEPKVDIDFSKLTREDLEKLVKALGEPMHLVQLGLKQLREKARNEVLDRPLKEFLNGGPLLDVKAQGEGPLGLGILPALFGGKNRRSEKGLAKKH